MNFLLVFLGAGLGGTARYAISLLTIRVFGTLGFPWATLGINVLGSFLMGLLLGGMLNAGEQSSAAEPWRLFLGVGILGGFTTFSAFSAETLELANRGEYWLAAMYVLASLVLAVAAAFLGFWLMKAIA
ncbi:MAG: fluoride efflux transporter CrcB [Microbacteriaceae bacterium]